MSNPSPPGKPRAILCAWGVENTTAKPFPGGIEFDLYLVGWGNLNR